MSGVHRRTFLKGVALAAAGSATGAITAASAAQTRGGAGAVAWRKAPCPFCSVGCGLLVGVRDGRAVAVKGDPESEVSRGLACVKGYYAVHALQGRDRITRPLVRRNGRLVEVPLAEALDLVADRLRATMEQHGSDSVGVYGSAHWTVADRYVASKLFRGALGTRNVESDDRLEAGSAAAGLRGSFGMNGSVGCFEDIDHADIFVLWDHNIAETDPVLFSRMLERRRTNPGVRIIDVATRTTRTSYAADRSLLFAPATEIALVHALCHEIVSRRWADLDFIERYVSFHTGADDIGYGLEGALVSEVAAPTGWTDYVRFLEAYSPRQVERVTGVAVADIEWLATLYGDRSRRVVSLWGAGINAGTRGTWANNVLFNLHLLVGRIAAPGNGALSTAGSGDSCTAVECGGALTPIDGPAAVPTDAQQRLAARLWDVPQDTVDARAAGGVLTMFRALEQGELRFLWTQATDPMTALPNLSRYRAAAARAGSFLVATEAYPTPTTDVADVVLPAAFWIETDGVAGNAERRMQHFEQMLVPPGEATDAAWQMIEVARRLGMGALFPWARGQHATGAWQEYARFHAAASRRAPPLAALRARPGVLWPFIDGRETKWRYNTAHDVAADAGRGAFDFYGHADHRAWIWLRPHVPPAEAPDAAFPFWLASGRVLEHDGAATRRVPTLHRAMPAAYVELHAADAAELGIRSGDRVRLTSRRGTLELDARIDHRTQPARGGVFVPSFDESLPVNVLSLDASCPLSGQPDYGCAVRVERIERRSTP